MKTYRDDWDPLTHWHGAHTLTSIEVTVTERCNMRCAYCAVGEQLRTVEREMIPLDSLLRALDAVPTLRTLSVTGGEPFLVQRVVRDTIRPLLVYAKSRGLKTQVNTNLTLDIARYAYVADVVDVFHISHNAPDAHTYAQTSFANVPGADVAIAHRWFEAMHENARSLAAQGAFVSVETMMSPITEPHIAQLHADVVAMGARRHEVHPMYPTSFAKHLPVLHLDQMRALVHRLLDVHDHRVWMLFGTLPFFPCGNEEDQRLWQRLWAAPHVTVRNDPDGRNRLNVNMFTGAVTVTDFVHTEPLGTVLDTPLTQLFARSQVHPDVQALMCMCAEARCCGPNAIVARTYYADVSFLQRKAIVAFPSLESEVGACSELSSSL